MAPSRDDLTCPWELRRETVVSAAVGMALPGRMEVAPGRAVFPGWDAHGVSQRLPCALSIGGRGRVLEWRPADASSSRLLMWGSAGRRQRTGREKLLGAVEAAVRGA
jgi:hypothetical protein